MDGAAQISRKECVDLIEKLFFSYLNQNIHAMCAQKNRLYSAVSLGPRVDTLTPSPLGCMLKYVVCGRRDWQSFNPLEGAAGMG